MFANQLKVHAENVFTAFGKSCREVLGILGQPIEERSES